MTAKEIYELLLSEAIEKLSPTCDGLIAGDENKKINKLGVCFKLTSELIAKAAELGLDMVITHEGVFSQTDNRSETTDPIDLKKWELIDKSGLAIYRFHDHAHNTDPDYIHAGFIRDVGLEFSHKYERECLGICRYDLASPLTVRDIAKLIKDKLGVEFVRIVGDRDLMVKTVMLGLGGVSVRRFRYMRESGGELFITGESPEVRDCEYIRDMCFFGERKAAILMGHYSAEFSGMRLIAERLDKLLPTVYLDSGEVCKGI